MTHHPEAEEILQHLIAVHACSEAISLRQEIISAVTSRRAASTLIPADGSIQVDVTADVAEAVADRLGEFDRLHDGHHAQQIAARMLEFLKDDELGLPHEHDTVKQEE
jgi:hypothetical protein